MKDAHMQFAHALMQTNHKCTLHAHAHPVTFAEDNRGRFARARAMMMRAHGQSKYGGKKRKTSDRPPNKSTRLSVRWVVYEFTKCRQCRARAHYAAKWVYHKMYAGLHTGLMCVCNPYNTNYT